MSIGLLVDKDLISSRRVFVMTEHVKKVMIIGLDAPLTATVYNYAKEGKLPNIKKLIEEGVYAKNCLVPRAWLDLPLMPLS